MKFFKNREKLLSPQKIHQNSYADLTTHNSEKHLSFWSLTDFNDIQAIGECCTGQKDSPKLFLLRSISQKYETTEYKRI